MSIFNCSSSLSNDNIITLTAEQQNKIKYNVLSFETKYKTKLELVENIFQDYKTKIFFDTNDKIDLLIKQQEDLIQAGEKHKNEQLNELEQIQIEFRQHEIKMNEIIVNKDTPTRNHFHLNYEWNKFEIFNAKIHKVDFNLGFDTNKALFVSNSNYNWIGDFRKTSKSDEQNSKIIPIGLNQATINVNGPIMGSSQVPCTSVSVPFLQTSQAPGLSQPMPPLLVHTSSFTSQISSNPLAFPAASTPIFFDLSRSIKTEYETPSDSIFKFNPDCVSARLNSRLVFNENSEPLNRHEVIELINVLFVQMRAYNPILWYPSRNYYERVLETLFDVYPNIQIADNKHATTQKNLLGKIRTKYGNNRRKEKIAVRYTTEVPPGAIGQDLSNGVLLI